ncbi:MAG: ATP-binding protein, partial [Chloroflexota bacterium]
ATSSVRRLVYDLRPPTLDDLGLVGALQQSAARLEGNGLRFAFEVEEPLPELPAAVETAVYRIVHEALTNVARHAQATRATVSLQQIDHQLMATLVATLVATVEDNGVGLAAGQPSGVGLQSMQERAAELNGRFVIESTPKEGTKVSVWLPLRQDEGGETDV